MNPSILVSGLVGLVCGVLSAYGVGGGSLLVVALCSFFGKSIFDARLINLIYFAATVPIAIFLHGKSKLIFFRTLFPAILFGCIGSALGAYLSAFISNGIFAEIYGFFLLAVGVFELFKKPKQPPF